MPRVLTSDRSKSIVPGYSASSRIAPLAVKLGIVTPERVTGILAGLEHGATNEGYSLWPLLLSAWKTKPR